MKELDILKQSVLDLDAPSLITDSVSEKQVEMACVHYLEALGYKVSAKVVSYRVKDLDQLIDLFYSALEYKSGEVCALTSNRKKDRALFSNFIKQRQQELGCSHAEGLNDCANIIFGLFKFEDQLDLSLPMGTWVFGSDKCKWITDKVINMLNNIGVNDLVVERMVDRYSMLHEDDYQGFDFDKLRRIHG